MGWSSALRIVDEGPLVDPSATFAEDIGDRWKQSLRIRGDLVHEPRCDHRVEAVRGDGWCESVGEQQSEPRGGRVGCPQLPLYAGVGGATRVSRQLPRLHFVTPKELLGDEERKRVHVDRHDRVARVQGLRELPRVSRGACTEDQRGAKGGSLRHQRHDPFDGRSDFIHVGRPAEVAMDQGGVGEQRIVASYLGWSTASGREVGSVVPVARLDRRSARVDVRFREDSNDGFLVLRQTVGHGCEARPRGLGQVFVHEIDQEVLRCLVDLLHKIGEAARPRVESAYRVLEEDGDPQDARVGDVASLAPNGVFGCRPQVLVERMERAGTAGADEHGDRFVTQTIPVTVTAAALPWPSEVVWRLRVRVTRGTL